jgi:glycosyltransferase involved in cell wall biosynthesis
MMKPKFLVILPSYNGEKFLEQQIESILNQQDVEVRIFIRDDCSTDGTKAILKNYESRISLEYGDSNLGTYLSLHRMLTMSDSSEYVAFADQDDTWERNHLIEAFKYLEKSPVSIPALYFPQYRYIDGDGKILGIRPPRHHVGISNALVENPAIGCGVVLNNPAVQLLRNINPCTFLHMDQQAYFCISLMGEIHQGNQVTVNYRIHASNQVGIPRNKLRQFVDSATSRRLRTARFEQEHLYRQLKSQLEPKIQIDLDRHFDLSRRNLLTRAMYVTHPVFRREGLMHQLVFMVLTFVNWA